jgi:opacity protein-like surface antigen
MKSWKAVAVFALAVMLALPVAMSAQTDTSQGKHEVTIQGSGFITKETTNNGITNDPTNSGGFLVGYRYNLNRWFSFEGDFDYFRNSQKYGGSASLSMIKTNVYSGTGSLVVKLSSSNYVKPYALVGGGVMVFDPRDTSTVSTQARSVLAYGGGIDMPLSSRFSHVAFRGEYRGFVYKVSDFGMKDAGTRLLSPAAPVSWGRSLKHLRALAGLSLI